jgi:hypothetical protein
MCGAALKVWPKLRALSAKVTCAGASSCLASWQEKGGRGGPRADAGGHGAPGTDQEKEVGAGCWELAWTPGWGRRLFTSHLPAPTPRRRGGKACAAKRHAAGRARLQSRVLGPGAGRRRDYAHAVLRQPPSVPCFPQIPGSSCPPPRGSLSPSLQLCPPWHKRCCREEDRLRRIQEEGFDRYAPPGGGNPR